MRTPMSAAEYSMSHQISGGQKPDEVEGLNIQRGGSSCTKYPVPSSAPTSCRQQDGFAASSWCHLRIKERKASIAQES